MIKKDIKRSICSLFLIIFLSNNCYSESFFSSIKNVFGKTTDVEKTKASNNTKNNNGVEDVFELSIDENLANPELGKYSYPIVTFQKEQEKYLKKNKFKTELIRNGEVIKITVPATSLFNANDTVLLSGAVTAIIQPLLRYLAIPDLYRMVLVMHTDNTGTNAYTFNLSRARVESVFGSIESKKVNVDFVIPYAQGGSEPIEPNNSISNRAINRRLEIYLVPGRAMIEQVKKGAITLK